MFGNVLTGKGGIGGTFDYNELKNTPIINQDLNNGEIEAVNPIQVGDTAASGRYYNLYYNKDVTPDLSKLDWTNATVGEYSELSLVLCAGEDDAPEFKNSLNAVKYPKGLSADGITFTSDSYVLVVRNEFIWVSTEYLDSVERFWGHMSSIRDAGGWWPENKGYVSGASIIQVNQQDIWGAWVSKDGQWRKGSYKGEAGTYYRHIGDDKIVPVNPIQVGETLDTIYFNQSVLPNPTELDWSGAVNGVCDFLFLAKTSRSIPDSSTGGGLLWWYKMPKESLNTTEEVYGLQIAKNDSVVENLYVFCSKQDETIIAASEDDYGLLNAWKLSEIAVTDSPITECEQQDIWGSYISKDGQWKTVYQKGSIYYYDGSEYKAVCTTDYVDNAIASAITTALNTEV